MLPLKRWRTKKMRVNVWVREIEKLQKNKKVRPLNLCRLAAGCIMAPYKGKSAKVKKPHKKGGKSARKGCRNKHEING